MTGIGKNSFANQFVFVIGVELLQQARKVAGTEPGIHQWDFLFEIVLVALRKTTGNVDFFNQAIFLGIDIAKDSVNGFLFGIVDKPARIDDHNIGIVLLGFMSGINLVAFELGEQHLAVDQVFRAAQGYNVDFIFTKAFGFQ